ncbi:hypothetical protein F4803DRAFT_567249 [Xylaria telfairii]|nr:hypothetical protein F4803DRAFT_567249 [Xylaria telfairii]
MKSELLPSQKAIIAMSCAQYLAYLRPSTEDGSQATSSAPNSEKDEEETKRNPAQPIISSKHTDKLSVGVCIFRLDGQTLSPAVLLLRRSPRWWRRRILASGGGRDGAGEWELPGGKVEDDDFCISAAIDRLVREKTGLRVTKIMAMLSDVRRREELKVLLWEDDVDDVEGSTSEYPSEDGDSDGNGVKIKVDLSVDMGWAPSTEDGNSGNTDKGKGIGTHIGNGNEISSGAETLVSPLPLDPEALGIRILTDSSSPDSSAPRLTTDSGSSSVSAPPVPPKDPGRYAWVHREHNDAADDDDDDDDYHADYDCRKYRFDEDYDPSLEPAPLSVPSLNPKPPRRRVTALSPRAPPASLVRVHWRNAQVIPYNMVRREYLQLNFTVLVDEDPGGEVVPVFLGRHDADDGDGGGGGKEGHEHDALEWATCARVEKLPMSEDLRRVVFEGLAWMGSRAGGFF